MSARARHAPWFRTPEDVARRYGEFCAAMTDEALRREIDAPPPGPDDLVSPLLRETEAALQATLRYSLGYWLT